MSLRRILGSITSAVADRFYDTFDRTGSDLGTANDGTRWSALRGSLQTNGTQAVTTDSPSNYPAATVSVPSQNVEIRMMDVQNGSGALLWVTDSNNWWAIDVYQYSYSQCSAYTAYYTFAGSYWSYCSVPSYSYACTAYYCNGFNHPYYKNATYCRTTCKTGYTYIVSCLSYVSGPNYTYGGQTCSAYTTVYPRYIRLLRMLAGSVSEITSVFVGNSQYVGMVKAILSGNQVTAKAYSDAGSAQIGSDLVYTATGATITPTYGIVITPQPVSQGTVVGQLEIIRND